MDKPAPDPLKAIRDRIDAIDEAMHRLLIERSGVISELIRIKGTSQPGAAFRPDREAEMMRRLAMRHSGALPLTSVEHLWREIITTFTAMQAPFAVVSGPATDPLALRDVARFYFGFSVDIQVAGSNEEAIAEVAKSGKWVALVHVSNHAGRWWTSLAGAGAPRIFARLPFIEIAERPADLPVYVIGPPLKDAPQADIKVVAMKDARGLQAAIAASGGIVVAEAGGELLVELPVAIDLGDLATAGTVDPVHALGSFFQPIRHLAERTA